MENLKTVVLISLCVDNFNTLDGISNDSASLDTSEAAGSATLLKAYAPY